MALPSVNPDFSLSMFFCLKYLKPSEFESWAESLTEIDNPNWQVAILRWWLGYVKLTEEPENWPINQEIGHFHEVLNSETDPLRLSVTPFIFTSLDAFLPIENRAAFHSALKHHLTKEVFE